jgi:hypothetical protein
MSLARTLIPFLGGLLVMNHVMTQTEFQSLNDAVMKLVTDAGVVAGLLMPVLTAVWGMVTHSDSAVIKAAGDVPGVSVQVAPTAAPEIVKVAQDPAVPNVDLTKPSN